MSARPSVLARFGVSAALLAALAGCSDSAEEAAKSAPGNAPATTAVPSTGTTGTTGNSGTSGTAGSPSTAAAVDPTGPPPIVPGREYFSGGARWRVEVVELRRRETFLLVKARVTLLAPRPNSDSESAYSSWANGANTTAEDFQVLDLINRKRHLVARDPEGRCVCTRSVHMLRLYPGQATVFEATFAAPPPDVTKVEVVAPTPMGTFSDVPLS